MNVRALLMAIPMLATAADLRIDHVTIAGKSLALMEEQLAAAGLRFESGGAHTNHATEMAIASFPDGSYIELIAPQKDYDPAALAQHHWSKFIEGNAGPCAFARAAARKTRCEGLALRRRPVGGELLQLISRPR